MVGKCDGSVTGDHLVSTCFNMFQPIPSFQFDPPWTFANVKKVEPNVNCQVDIALKPEAEGGGKSRKHQNAGHDCVQRLEKEQLLQVLHFVGVHWRAQDRQKMPFLDGRKALKTGSWIGND